MPDLSRELRRSLEATVKAARVAAEAGAADAVRRLGVAAAELPAHLEARRAERNRLRAHARSLGDRPNKEGTQEISRLVEAAAYVQWHRLLFARFLAERGLLRDEAGVVISLADCREEAAMGSAGDEWSVAAAHAARLLPGVFPPDDPVESLTLSPEHGKALRDHLRGLNPAIFQADDSLGWTYQFWRAAEKKAVNDSQVKIGAAELPAVTQLFTEPYMVRFLLHNTLGAWWAGKVLMDRPGLAREAADEAALRAACTVPGYEWDYLRFVREDDVWRPAAGLFPGWPARAADITVLDPCCGSGHFLTEALGALAALRGVEEDLTQADAVVAALRDNLAGLEIDGRCVQIAAFALAITAWRIGGVGTKLPTPHVAWVGAPPPLPKSEFVALANGDAELQRGLEALHDLFAQAPLLGSLIEVTGGDLVNPARIARIEESIAALVEKMRGAEPERAEGALAARGMADAAALLAKKWTVQATNVPFLSASKMVGELRSYVASRFEPGKADLATSFLCAMLTRASSSCTVALVSPQNWYQLGAYRPLREQLLTRCQIRVACDLGPAAFHDMNWWAARTSLTIVTNEQSQECKNTCALNAENGRAPAIKSTSLKEVALATLDLDVWRKNPDFRITMQAGRGGTLLSNYAQAPNGMHGGDSAQFRRKFWEQSFPDVRWTLFQRSLSETSDFGGREHVFFWPEDGGNHRNNPQARIQGEDAWKHDGVVVSMMGSLQVTRYTGEKFDIVCSPIVPFDINHLPAVWMFCSSPEYYESVRLVDQKTVVTNATLTKIPFNLARWQNIAAEQYPNGLPEPYSDDPTQWVFHGHPRYAEAGTELHVALARLAGYRWPAEIDTDMRLSAEARARIAEAATLPEADGDGLLALVPVLGERPLADRLRAFCTTAWGDAWQASTEAALIAAASGRANDNPPKQLTLDTWLRTHAARQHAKSFHDRPFLWWITEGRTDGFTVVAHYHRLTRANLERLAYTVLGDWITRLGDDPRAEAARVLQAKLARILEGGSPFDIFVRWKPLVRQPLGWDPDLDDGVRLNIRPFVEARVLAHVPNVKYGVDRGKDVASAPWSAAFNGERRNDHHTTLAEKLTARAALATAAK